MIALLAGEQEAGRLHISPALVVTAGEWLGSDIRGQIATVFGCAVHDAYATSEFMGIAFDRGRIAGRLCGDGWLHLNSDLVILEPVDEQYEPVPSGHTSRTVLLTNLVNRVQPLIRYDLGDSITVRPDRCPCGCPLPAIRVEGRRDDILYVQKAKDAQDGQAEGVASEPNALPVPPVLLGPHASRVPLLPRALATLIREVPGVHRFQVIQTAPDTLSVRLQVVPQADRQKVWEGVVRTLRAYLLAQGACTTRLRLMPELPARDPISGKFREVWVARDAVSSG
jgi:phenylacetate-coenzyme A ligase PaaK-like adenylate-forming protein